MIFPVIRIRPLKGANATNWPGLVILDPDAPLPAAVLAQEVWESLHKLNPANALRVRFSRSARRRMEVMGHECEVQAAALFYGKDEAEYRRAEAARMRAGYDGLFEGMAQHALAIEMKKNAPEAARFVRDHQERLARYITIKREP